ncbi:MAG: hypothetical protein DCC65_06920 [Planctomycetota bacterium]|nr:MAG: hypothetical protein DCC65_06920 [Planctomycetota bacterium]
MAQGKKDEKSNQRQWKTPDTELAFNWLTAPGSVQAEQLEVAMRDYPQPRYDIVDIGRGLMKVLSSPNVKFGGVAARIDSLVLAEAVLDHAIASGWDVIEERTLADQGPRDAE